MKNITRKLTALIVSVISVSSILVTMLANAEVPSISIQNLTHGERVRLRSHPTTLPFFICTAVITV